jgi:transposase
MSRVSKLLNDDVVENAKKALSKLGKYGYVSKKLLAVIAASKHNIKEVAKIYDISRTTLTSWVSYVKDLQFDKLEAPKERRKKTRLNLDQLEILESWISTNPNITIRELKIRIEQEFGILFSQSGVHKMLKRLNLSYITPRPNHHKQDKTLAEEFKKKSTAILK